MKTARQVGFASLPFEARLKVATAGMSISAYANGTSRPVPVKRAVEVERIASEALKAFNLNKRTEPA